MAPGQPAAAWPDGKHTVDTHAALAAGYLERLPESERPYKRLLSWCAVPPEVLDREKRVLRWWLHNLSTGPTVVLPEVVGGSEGRLWSVDLRDYRWNAFAFSAVARREPYCTEHRIKPQTARDLRALILVEQDEKTLHCEALVRADWLLRETMESDRSPSYYDLLYAGRRFVPKAGASTPPRVAPATTGAQVQTPVGTVREEVVDHPGGPLDLGDERGTVNVGPGRYVVKRRTPLATPTAAPAAVSATTGNGFTFVDFPATIDDWNEHWGLTAIDRELARLEIDVRTGAVVAGSKDDPVRGSIVARQNRVVVTQLTPWGTAATRTFDAKRTAGKTDFTEQHQTIVLGKIKFDAGEALVITPVGGQAALLFGGDGKRTEIAPSTFAHNRADPRYQDVRTAMGCVTCHAPDGGFIIPRDLTREHLRAGVDHAIKDRDLRNRALAFFLEWDEKVAGWRAPYLKLIARTTVGADGKPYSPAQLQAAFLASRNRYDDPLSTEVAAMEAGMPVPLYRLLLSRSTRNRVLLLVQGVPCPRETWEADIYPEVVKLMRLHWDDPDVMAVCNKHPGWFPGR